MKIPLTLASRIPTAQTNKARSIAGEKRAPVLKGVDDATARGISKIGETIHAGYMDYKHQEQVREMAKANTQTTEALDGLYDTISNGKNEDGSLIFGDMTVDEHEQYFNTQAKAIKDNVLGGMKNHLAKQAFGTHYDKLASGRRVQTQGLAQQRAKDATKAEMATNLNALSNRFIAGGPNAAGAATEANQYIEAARASGAISDTEAEGQARTWNRNTLVGFWSRSFDTDPIGTRNDLFQKKVDKDGRLVPIPKKDLPLSLQNADEDLLTKVFTNGRTAWDRAKKKMTVEAQDHLDDIADQYMENDDPEFRKQKRKEAMTYLNLKEEQDILSPREIKIAKDNFIDGTIGTSWKRQSDEHPETTFLSTHRPINARDKKAGKEGFVIDGSKEKWIEIAKSPLTGEWTGMSEEKKRQLSLYIRHGYEDKLKNDRWGRAASKILLNDDIAVYHAEVRKDGQGERGLEARILNSWGEEAGPERLEVFKRNETLNKAIHTGSNTLARAETPQAQAKIMTETRTGITDDPNSPINFVRDMKANRRETYTTGMATENARINRERKEDPALFYAKTYAKELQGMDKKQGRDFLLGKQRTYGLEDHELSIMPKANAKTTVGRLLSAPGAEVALELAAMKAEYGADWNIVLRDMTNQGLPKAMDTIASINPFEDPIMAEQMGEASKKKISDLKKGIDPTEIEGIKTDINEAVSDLRKSMMKGGLDRKDGVDAIAETIEKTVLLKVAGGMEMEDAIAEVKKSVIDDNFQDLDFNKTDTLIPRTTKNGVNISPNQVEDVLKMVDNRLENYDYKMPPNPNPVVVDAATYKNRFITLIRDNGYWALNPNMTGLMKYSEAGYPVEIMSGGRAVPLERSWEEIQTIYSTEDKARRAAVAAREPVLPGIVSVKQFNDAMRKGAK